ncbi:MAG: 4Fe-4S single cluster domain-containing protein [Polyangiaceae bacterium]
MLRLAKRIRSTTSEGPGARYAVWVQGCAIRCAGCCNPEMFAPTGGELVSCLDLVADITSSPAIEGVSFLGGEPFEQAAALANVARSVRAAGLSVMTYTGRVYEELVANENPAELDLLANTDLLADGPFDRAQPGSRYRWLGSQNQRLFALSARYSLDDPRLVGANTIDIRLGRDGLLEISGWPALADALARDLSPRRRPR